MTGRIFPSGFFVAHGRAVRSAISIALLVAFVLPASAPSARSEDDVPWTQRPMKVDRSKQTYQRLPARQQAVDTRSWFSVPDRIRVIDSARFSIDGKVYRIGGVHPVAMGRICRDREAGRWSCGRLAGVLLGNLVRNTRLLCNVTPSGTETVLGRCQSRTKDIAREIVAAGFGRADGDSTLASIEALARSDKAGLWRNPACLADFDHC